MRTFGFILAPEGRLEVYGRSFLGSSHLELHWGVGFSVVAPVADGVTVPHHGATGFLIDIVHYIPALKTPNPKPFY